MICGRIAVPVIGEPVPGDHNPAWPMVSTKVRLVVERK